jgi:MYXO-CTERM domain-containing protein
MLILACGFVFSTTTCQVAEARPTEWKSKAKKDMKAKYWWTNKAKKRCNADGSGVEANPPHAGQFDLVQGEEASVQLPEGVDASGNKIIRDVDTESGQLNNDGTYVNVSSEGIKRNALNKFETDLPGVLDRHQLEFESIDWPSFFENAGVPVLHVAVDVDQFYLGGAPQYDVTHTFDIVNGLCSELPGYMFGTTEITLHPDLGLVNADPYTGSGLISAGTGGIAMTVPEPSACALAVLGGALVRRRRAK